MRLVLIVFLFSFQTRAQYVLISEVALWEKEGKAIVEDPDLISWAAKEIAFRKAGFWLLQKEDSVIHLGPKISLGHLQIDSLDFDLKGRTLNDSNWQESVELALRRYADQGYPFAQITIRNYRITNHALYAYGSIEKGLKYYFDSLIVLGYEEVDPILLHYETDWQKGQIYSDGYLHQLQQKLRASSYLSASRAPAVAFYPDGSHLYLYLNKRGANQISGVVGLNTEADGRSTLNGDFNLKLLNTFNKGESVNLRWRSPDQSVQDFHLSFAYPYLLGSPIGIHAGLELFRQDSSFIRRQYMLGLNYRLAYQAFFDINGQFKSSNALGAGSPSFQNLGTYRSVGLSLGFRLMRLNQSIVATKGYNLDIHLGSASREANEEQWQQYDWNFSAAYYRNFLKNWVWHQEVRTEGIGGSPLFENELLRLGGIHSLRGFNELSLFSNAYGLLRSEIRYMLGSYDYLCVFGDLAYSENTGKALYEQYLHSGLGAGINFQTKGGIFSLFLAVGQTNDESYDFRSTKVHLSYVNTF